MESECEEGCPFERKLMLTLKYAQLITWPLVSRAGFISSKSLAESPTGSIVGMPSTRHTRDAIRGRLGPTGRRAAGVETKLVSGRQAP